MCFIFMSCVLCYIFACFIYLGRTAHAVPLYLQKPSTNHVHLFNHQLSPERDWPRYCWLHPIRINESARNLSANVVKGLWRRARRKTLTL